MENRDFHLATASDSTFASRVLNLIGSVQENSDIFSKIHVYDLGLTRQQRFALSGIEGVELKKVPPFIPNWQKCWSWKAWVWKNTEADYLLYLDAGVTVLRDLSEVADILERQSYFLVSQYDYLPGGHTVHDIMPTDYYSKFGLNRDFAKKEVIAAGIVGFKRDSYFYKRVIEGVYRLTLEGHNLGWSKEDWRGNKGIHWMPDPPLRNCRLFRHDQTLLNLLAYKHIENVRICPSDKYAGYKSPQDHPNQLIWHHRLKVGYGYFGSIHYKNLVKKGAMFMLSLVLRAIGKTVILYRRNLGRKRRP